VTGPAGDAHRPTSSAGPDQVQPAAPRSPGGLPRHAYYLFVARGLVALSLGVTVLATGSNFDRLTTFIAIYWIVAALLTLQWVGVHRGTAHRPLALAAGALALVAGLTVILRHVLDALVSRGVLLDLLGASAIAMGLLRLSGMVHDDQLVVDRPRLRYRALAGTLEVLLGIAVVVTETGPSDLTRLVVGVWALAMGTFLILDAWKMRRLVTRPDDVGDDNSWTRRRRLHQMASTSAWLIPATYVLAAIALGVAVPRIDAALGNSVPVQFGVGAAQSLLTAFATGLITVMGFIITVVIAAATFSSTAVSPRMVRELQQNTTIRHVFGLLLLSVVYAFLVLNRVAPPDRPDYVPDFAVWLITPLLILDVVGLMVLVREMGHSLRLVNIIDRVYRRAEQVITVMYPEDLGSDNTGVHQRHAPGENAVIVPNLGESGVVAHLDVHQLVAEAARLHTTIDLVCRMGSYVAKGGALLRVEGAESEIDRERLDRAVDMADERTIDQDPLYAFRLLVDIATRALSPAVNDPTTAVQALDRIEALLRILASRRLDSGMIRDHNDVVRLVVPLPGWDDFLLVGLTEIRQFGAHSTQVTRRLRALLDDLLLNAPPCRRAAVARQLALLDQTVAASVTDPVERDLALQADRHGLGGAMTSPQMVRAAEPPIPPLS